MEKLSTELLRVFGAFFILIALFAAALVVSIWSSWCFAKVWLWHIVPIHPAIPAVDWKAAWGAICLVGFFRHIGKLDDEGPKEIVVGLIRRSIALVIILAFAWWTR